MEETNWNTPKPREWKSEELSQGRIIDVQKSLAAKQVVIWDKLNDGHGKTFEQVSRDDLI